MTLRTGRDRRCNKVGVVAAANSGAAGVVGAVHRCFIVMTRVTGQCIDHIPDRVAGGEVAVVGTGRLAAVPLDQTAGVSRDPGGIESDSVITMAAGQSVLEIAAAIITVADDTLGTAGNQIAGGDTMLGVRRAGCAGLDPTLMTFTAVRGESVTGDVSNRPSGIGEVVRGAMTAATVSGRFVIGGSGVIDVDDAVTVVRGLGYGRIPVGREEGEGVAGTAQSVAIFTAGIVLDSDRTVRHTRGAKIGAGKIVTMAAIAG